MILCCIFKKKCTFVLSEPRPQNVQAVEYPCYNDFIQTTMHKILTTFLAFVAATAAMTAQSGYLGGYRAWTISAQAGPAYSINENHFTYGEHGHGGKLFSMQGSVAVGYEFSKIYSLRVAFNYAGNRSAANSRESYNRFYPYSFKSVSLFADAAVDIASNYGFESNFDFVLYAGVGGAYSYDFRRPEKYGEQPANPGDWNLHPWQDKDITLQNYVPGFRLGFITEYQISDSFGIFADLCGEAYQDRFNGLMPKLKDHGTDKGYAGFPLDLRFNLSFGLRLHILQ